jgi:hypothetical protein
MKKITTIDLNTLTSRQSDISNSPNISTFSTSNPLPQTSFIVNENLPKVNTLPQVDTLLVKRKHLRIIKHKINKFSFKKPTLSSLKNLPHIKLLKFSGIEKLKEVFKKTKSLNKNSEILAFF